MADCKPFLNVYGVVHALSSRGVHVRESARSWKLIVPMSAERIVLLRALCEQLDRADAAQVLQLIARASSESKHVHGYEMETRVTTHNETVTQAINCSRPRTRLTSRASEHQC